MPRKRDSFDPYHANKHETTKSARRNYLKRQALNLGPSPSQLRKIEARIAASQRAHDRREKDQKRAKAKIARLEKERKEKEAREKLVQEGKLKPEDLLPKVAASQPRLTSFFGGLKARLGEGAELVAVQDSETTGDEGTRSDTDAENTLSELEEVESEVDEADSETETESVKEAASFLRDIRNSGFSLEEVLGGDPPEQQGPLAPVQDQLTSPNPAAPDSRSGQDLLLQDLETLISQMTDSQQSVMSETLRDELAMELPKPCSQDPSMAPLANVAHPQSTQEQVDAQLSSETQYDLGSALEIFEDLQANRSPPRSPNTLSRKRKADELGPELAQSPNKRPVFARMSPSKVNVRAQEKPDPVRSQASADLFDGLCTQDLVYNFPEDQNVSDKENNIPEISKKAQCAEKTTKVRGSQVSMPLSFDEALRELSKAPEDPKEVDMETDYGDLLEFEDDLDVDDFPMEDDAWLQEAIMHDVPPSPSKRRVTAPAKLLSSLRAQRELPLDVKSESSSGKGKARSDSSFDTSLDLDDADLLQAAEACDSASNPRKKRRRIPWSDTAQKDEAAHAGPSKCKAAGQEAEWEALEAMGSTFPVDF